jgi:hypothetical protein
VAGAIVRFRIEKGRASFDGARTLTVTTDAAGRAAATGFAATGRGTLQIAASAAFQGQTAAVTIAHTNVMTAAQVASASAAGGAAGSGGGIGIGTLTAIGAGVAGGVIGYQQYQNLRQGDPPEMGPLEPIPKAGFQNATRFLIGGAPGSKGIIVGSGDPDVLDARLQCEWGDGTPIETKSMSQGPGASCTHTYSTSGTFNIRQTVIDHWDRTASAETTVTVASMTGRWTSSATTGGVYNLVQNGGSITGTFTAQAGTASVNGSVSSGAFNFTGTTDPGRFSLSLPVVVGSTIVLATFAGTMPGDGDVNRVIGTLTGTSAGGIFFALTRQ